MSDCMRHWNLSVVHGKRGRGQKVLHGMQGREDGCACSEDTGSKRPNPIHAG
jgi:hypothetical protein